MISWPGCGRMFVLVDVLQMLRYLHFTKRSVPSPVCVWCKDPARKIQSRFLCRKCFTWYYKMIGEVIQLLPTAPESLMLFPLGHNVDATNARELNILAGIAPGLLGDGGGGGGGGGGDNAGDGGEGGDADVDMAGNARVESAPPSRSGTPLPTAPPAEPWIGPAERAGVLWAVSVCVVVGC